jgi:hypothetical protein
VIKKQLNSEKDIIAVISVMCDEMLLIRGKPLKSWRDRRIYYAPFKQYFPDIDLEKYSESEATMLLIDKYIKNYGPVTENDIVWWLGITKSKVQKALNALKSKLENIKIEGLDYNYIINKIELKSFIRQEESTSSIINILPNLDPYIMGYKDRERYVDYTFYEYIFDPTGNATATILINGFVAGIWDIIMKPEPQIKIYLFNKVEDQIKSQIELECKRVGKFITEKDVSINLCKKMVSLTKRTRGGFMSPLKEY